MWVHPKFQTLSSKLWFFWVICLTYWFVTKTKILWLKILEVIEYILSSHLAKLCNFKDYDFRRGIWGQNAKLFWGHNWGKTLELQGISFFSLQIYEVGGLVIIHVTQEDLTKFGCKLKRKLKIFGTSLCLCHILELIV